MPSSVAVPKAGIPSFSAARGLFIAGIGVGVFLLREPEKGTNDLSVEHLQCEIPDLGLPLDFCGNLERD